MGNLNRCGSPPDQLTFDPFTIPNKILEAFDNVEIKSRPEAYYGCP